MKREIGFLGSGMWALIILLVVGVWWVESRFGPSTAGYGLLAVYGVVCVVIGYLLCLAGNSTTLNGQVDLDRARMRINVEQARLMRQTVSGEDRIMAKVLGFAQALDRARRNNQTPAQISSDEFEDDPLDDRYDIDLSNLDYRAIRPK